MKIWMNIDVGADNLDKLKAVFPGHTFFMGTEPPEGLPESMEVLMGDIDEDILKSARNLKWFHSAASGTDHFIGLVDRQRPELIVTNGAGIYGVPISEHLLGMMLALGRRIDLSIRNMESEQWGGLPAGREITGSTVGIVGFGDIGSHLAALLVPFGCEVLAFKRTPGEKPACVSEMLFGDAGLDELMARADHICLCLPGTPQTRGIIDRRRIALMKPTACLYNVGRGTTVDTDALAEALQAGRIAGAGLDVTDPEPLPPGHALWHSPNTILTPHVSWRSHPNWENRLTEHFTRNLRAYLAGTTLPDAVDRKHMY